MRLELALSSAQLGVWHALKAGIPASAVNFGFYTKIFGEVNTALFEEAVRHVVAEAETLRVRIDERNDVPHQVVMAPFDWQLICLDVSRETDPLAAAGAWMEADMAQPVDLCHGPFFTYALFKVKRDEFLWYARYHHLIMDGFAASLIEQRVGEVYTALSRGFSVDYRALGSLAALVEEDADYRASEAFKADRRFWRDALAGCPQALTLSVRRQTLPAQFLRLVADFPAAEFTRLQQFAQQMRVSVPQFVTAAAAILIHRQTEAEDLVLGQTLGARVSALSRQTPAMVTNIVPLRLNISPEMSAGAVLEQVRTACLRGLRRQRYRIADLRRDLHQISKPLLGPLIDVRPFESNVQFAGHTSRKHIISNGVADDIEFHFVMPASDGGTLRIELNANPALYDYEDLARLQRRLMRLLTSLRGPADLVGRLDVLPDEERAEVLIDWNQTAADYPRGRCVHELIEEQALRTPDRVALVFQQQRMTYRELNKQAGRVARYLSGLRVSPDERVCLLVERSLDLAVGLLGILKAGGAYVPLDPNYPQDRLTNILEDAQPRVLLTQRALSERLQPRNADIVCLDGLPAGADTGFVPPQKQQQTDSLAYVLYTSGSTGKPKGVQIPHRALVNFLTAMAHEPGIGEKDKLLAVTSLSFDIAGLELFLPLVNGAEVTIAPSDVAADGFRLASLMETSGATIMQATPATWRLLLAAGWKGSKGLKILCGGEAWSAGLAEALRSRCGSLWNMYGPTETTIWSSVLPIEANQPVLIGPPIANTAFYVLDRFGQPVPFGVPGELHIGGDGLARGYQNRPDLTQEQFVADPFSVPGARMFKTGDRVRQRPDGRIEFLGRLDHQVKIAGFRIEPGEIESVLRLHPDVQDAVVVARDDKSGEKRLAAYVTPNSNGPAETVGLRRLLQRKLPAYMVPPTIIPLDAFPLTPNGKIDRAALPLPNEILQDTHETYVGPRTELEELLAGFWCSILQVRRVGIQDNFFDLGGDSLSMLQLSLEIERATGQSFPLTLIHEAPTIAEMAGILGGGRQVTSFSPLVLLRPGAKRPPVFILHGVGGSVMDLIPISQSMCADHPVYGIQAKGFDGVETPHDRIEEMAEYYAMAIVEVQPHGPYLLAGYSFGGLTALEIAHRLLERGERIGLLAFLETYPHPCVWPLRSRVDMFVLRRFRKFSQALRSLPLKEIVPYLGTLLKWLVRKLANWASGTPSILKVNDSLPPAAKAVYKGGIAAAMNYRPRYYPGKVNYLKCDVAIAVPRNPEPVWGRLVDWLEVETVPGHHMQMLSLHAKDIAAWLSHRIQVAMDQSEGRRPHIREGHS